MWKVILGQIFWLSGVFLFKDCGEAMSPAYMAYKPSIFVNKLFKLNFLIL